MMDKIELFVVEYYQGIWKWAVVETADEVGKLVMLQAETWADGTSSAHVTKVEFLPYAENIATFANLVPSWSNERTRYVMDLPPDEFTVTPVTVEMKTSFSIKD